MLVKDVMTEQVITVTTDDPVEKCASLMLKHNISGLPVLDQGGRVVGMVTEGDLIRRASRIKAPGYLEILGGLIYLGSPTKFVNEIKRAMSLTAGEMMTKKVVSVGPEASIEEAATLMVDHEVNRLPVLNAAGEVVGIVSRRDIMKHLYAK